jgi:hypothetical protein
MRQSVGAALRPIAGRNRHREGQMVVSIVLIAMGLLGGAMFAVIAAAGLRTFRVVRGPSGMFKRIPCPRGGPRGVRPTS